jgi:hypothetical protein
VKGGNISIQLRWGNVSENESTWGVIEKLLEKSRSFDSLDTFHQNGDILS